MLSLWSSLGQRLGTVASRVVQAANSVSSPFFTSKLSNVTSPATQRCFFHSGLKSFPIKESTPRFLFPSKMCSSAMAPSRSATFEYMHRKGLYVKVRRKRLHPLEGRPQMRGVVLKTLIKKPKKPNSANRKCVRLRLTNGKEVTAYVPGEGHNLQEHNIVLVEGGRLQDTPGVKLVCIRGKYDLPHVKKKA